MIWQLRTYTIAPGHMDAFRELWHEWVVPARERLGFTVHGGWYDGEEGVFVWIVSHEAPDGWEEAERRYYTEGGRENFPIDPKDIITRVETRFLAPA